jgi:hypothetical protein
MPTRPVTWDLDIPPESLLESPRPAPPPRDVPSIDRLRASLMGTRFEFLKISAFAAFLLGFVGVAVHGSQLNNPDNPLVANTSAAFKGLAATVSNQTVSIRGETATLALAATRRAEAALARTTAPTAHVLAAQTARADQLKNSAAHRGIEGTSAAEVAALGAQHLRRAHHHPAPVEVAAAETSSDSQWSGSLLDLPNFVSAEGSKAGHRILQVMQGGAQSNAIAQTRGKRAHAKSLAVRHHEAANPDSLTARDSTSFVAGMLAPDRMVAAMAALLLYLIFVVVLVQIKGGLRAFGDNHAAV